MVPFSPKVKGSYYVASLQHFIDYYADNAIVVAAPHWSIRVCHYHTTLPPSRASASRVEDVGMVYAAVKCRVIVYRGYGEAIVGLRGAMHLQGLPQTRGKYESHARYIAKLVRAQVASSARVWL